MSVSMGAQKPMSVRRSLRRAVGVTALTGVVLTTAPAFVGGAAALNAPTVVPTAGSTTGKRPTITATYASALDQGATDISVVDKDAPATRLGGTRFFSPDGKTVGFTLAADLADGGYEVRVAAVPADPMNLPPNAHVWEFTADATPPGTPAVAFSAARVAHTATVTGTTEPGASLSVSVANVTGSAPAVTGTTTANNAGAYSLALSLAGLADGAVRATVFSTDTRGNRSAAGGTATATKDTTGPARLETAPSDGGTSKSRTIVDVRFDEALDQAGSTITVKNGVGSTLAGATSFPAADTIRFAAGSTMTPLGGVYTVTTKAVDDLGNTRTTTSTFTVDDTKPATPSARFDLPVNAARAAAAVLSGTAEPGSALTISVTALDGAGDPVGTPVAGSTTAHATTGAYEVPLDLRPLADGPVRASVTARDGAGNDSTPGLSNVVAKDTVAPAAPTADLASPIAADRAATVTGTAEPDSVVRVSVDDANPATPAVQGGAIADGPGGAYDLALTLTGLADGTVTATVFARDAVGNESTRVTDTALLDTVAPALPTLSMPTVNAARKAAAVASGTAEPGTSVTVSVFDGRHDPLTRTVTAAAGTGAYDATFDTTPLNDGILTVTATVADAATNTSDTRTIGVTRDTAAPAQPTVVLPQWVNATTAVDGIEVSGTAEAGARVVATFADAAAGTADVVLDTVATGAGEWSGTVVLKDLADGTVGVTVDSADAAENPAPAATGSVEKDTVAPAAPTVALTNPITTDNVATATVSGTAANGTTIEVAVDDTDPGTSRVTGEGTVTGGTFSVPVDLTALSDGQVTATATALDAARNRSLPGTSAASAKDTTALARIATSPADAASVQPPATVSATFNEPLSTADTTIAVRDKTETLLAGATSFTNGNRTVVFTPVDTLSDAASPYTVTVVAKDADTTDPSETTFTFVVDTVAPAAPTVSVPAVTAANVAAVRITGTAEPGSSVAVNVDDAVAGSPVPGTATADAVTGAYSVDLDLRGLADGPLSASAVARDAADNASPAGTATSTKDATPPAAPTLVLPRFVNDATKAAVPVSGTAEPGDTVVVTVSDSGTGTVAETVTAHATTGAYAAELDLSGLADGPLSGTAAASDAAGNPAPATGTASSTKDTVAPAAPSLALPAWVNAANKAAVPATGSTEPGATVRLTVDDATPGDAVTATVPANDVTGAYSTDLDLTSLADGTVSASAVARDAAGNESASATATAGKDVVAPATPAVSLPARVNNANKAAVTVSGTAEPGSSVLVSLDDAVAGSPITRTLTADATTGAYTTEIDASGLTDGTLTATAVATDTALNDSAAGTATAPKDTGAPEAPTLVFPATVNAANVAAVPVSGVAEPGTSVTVSVDDSVAGGAVSVTAPADASSGAYSATLDLRALADGPLTVSAVATDALGNPSPATTATAVKDVAAPAAPTVALPDFVNAGSEKAVPVSGTAAPGAVLTLSFDDATPGGAVVREVTADAVTGAYDTTVDLSSLADGQVTATASVADGAGNVATGTDTATKDTVAPVQPTLVPRHAFVSTLNAHQLVWDGTAEPRSRLLVTVDDADATTAAVVSDSVREDDSTERLGTFDLRGLVDGTVTFTAVSHDAAGNASTTLTFTLPKDTVAPPAPTGSMPHVNQANQADVARTARSAPGTTVFSNVSDGVNARPPVGFDGALVDSEGVSTVHYDVSSLADGPLTVTMFADDGYHNRSEFVTFTVTKDTVVPLAPTVTMADPVNAAGATSVAVSGAAEPGSTVLLTVDDATPGGALSKEVGAHATTGAYDTTFDVSSLADGDITVTATARDGVGNVSPAATDTSVKDSTLPAVPTLTNPAPVTRASRAAAPFSGTAEPGATVTVTVDDADAGTPPVSGDATAGGDGAWSRTLDVSSLADGTLSVAVSVTDAAGNTSTATGTVTKNVTRAFTIATSATPVSGEARTVTVTAHQTYEIGSPVDTTYTGTPVLTSSDGHFTGGTCAPAVDGVATCTGVVFGDLGQQTLRATSGSGADLVDGSDVVRVQATGLAYGTPPPATARPGVPVTFTVVPTVGVPGASTAGYTATRTIVTTGVGGSTPATGTALACAQAECSVSVTWADRGPKTVKVTDNGTPSRSTPVATVRIPYETAMGIASSVRTVRSGGSLFVGGQLADMTNLVPLRGKQVVLYRKTAPSTTFAKLMTVTTDEDGIWIAQVSQTRNATYQARYAGDASYDPTTSENLTVLASQVVSATWSRSGRTVTVSGKVSPNAAGRTVYLQYRKADGTWGNAAKATVRSTGSYTMTKTFTASRSLRVYSPATSVNAAGASSRYRLP